MKKYYSILFAAAILSAAACNKEEIAGPAEVLGEPVEMTFSAVTEGAEADTKAALSNNSVIWTDSDQISVFSSTVNNTFSVSSLDNDGKLAAFTGSALKSDVYYGVFPYNASATITDGVIYTEIPAVQTAVANSFGSNAALAVAKTADKEFAFKNATALIGISTNQNLASIKLESTEGKSLAGAVKVSIEADGTPVTVAETGSAVEIDGTIAAGTTYYIAVVPGSYTGLKVTFTKADGSFAVKTNNVAIEIARNTAVAFGSFTLADSDFHAALRSYVLNGTAEVAAFLSGYDGSVREDVLDLTVTGSDVTRDQVGDLYKRVNNIFGTLTLDGTSNAQYNSGDWNDSIHFALERMHCKGSIVIRNILGIVKLTALSGYNGVINGDFIIENCPNVVTNWDNDGIQTLTEIKGDFKIIGKDGGFDANTFRNLTKIGGDFVFSGNNWIWNLTDYDANHPLEYIGGNIIIENNSSLWNINGLENLKHIGGNVTIRDNNPKFPRNNGNVDGSESRGFCTVQEWIANGVLSAGATVVLGSTASPIDVRSLAPCSSSIKASYVLNGSSEVAAFLNAGKSGETVINLTVTGADVTADQVNSLRNRVSHIEGTLTIDGVAANGEGGIRTSDLAQMGLEGGIILKNIACEVQPGGNSFPTHVQGDFVLQNIPNLLINDGWGSNSWGRIEQVDGDLVFDGCCSAIWRGNFFTSLQRVGGNFEIGHLPKSYLTAPALTTIGGDLIFHDIEQSEWMSWGEDGFFALANLGGKIVFRNITGGINTGAFPLLTSTGGIVYDHVGISRGLLSNVTTVNGDLELTAVKNWILFQSLTSVTGDVNIHDCPERFFSESVDGIPALQTVGGDFILKNLEADNYLIFTALRNVGGDFVIDNVNANSFNHGSTKLMFDNLQTVGGAFEMKNIPSGTFYIRFRGLTTVGGDLVLDNLTPDGFNHGDTVESFASLTSVGGNLTMSNFTESWKVEYENARIFKSMKNVGGDFTMQNITGIKRFYKSGDGEGPAMVLNAIGGNLVITGCSTLKSLNGFESLTQLGGNVTISGTAIPNTTGDNKNIGFCIFKGYRNSGVIGTGATISVGVDIDTLSTCN